MTRLKEMILNIDNKLVDFVNSFQPSKSKSDNKISGADNDLS